jgi:hypothetical protein
MAAWPQVVARLVDYLPTLPGWAGVPVFDGPPVTGESPTDYVTVGFVPGEDFGGDFEQVRGLSEMTEESGTVRCQIVSTTGDTDLPARRARAFELYDAWHQWVTDDPTLGVLYPSSSASLSAEVQPLQTTSGATQRLAVTVSYIARF